MSVVFAFVLMMLSQVSGVDEVNLPERAAVSSLSTADADHSPTCNIIKCLPFIKLRETLHLTRLQKQQVSQQRRYLSTVRDRLLDPGSKSRPPRHGGGIVSITAAQKAKILAFYGGYFSTKEDLPVQNSVQKRDSVDICPRVQAWDDVTLRLTDDNELSEVVQFDEVDRQWILEETCSQSTCSFVPQCTCNRGARLVRALVVNFHQTIISERYIKVYCCVAKKVSTS